MDQGNKDNLLVELYRMYFHLAQPQTSHLLSKEQMLGVLFATSLVADVLEQLKPSIIVTLH